MTYDADGEAVDLLDRLLSKERRSAERRSSSQEGVARDQDAHR